MLLETGRLEFFLCVLEVREDNGKMYKSFVSYYENIMTLEWLCDQSSKDTFVGVKLR